MLPRTCCICTRYGHAWRPPWCVRGGWNLRKLVSHSYRHGAGLTFWAMKIRTYSTTDDIGPTGGTPPPRVSWPGSSWRPRDMAWTGRALSAGGSELAGWHFAGKL